MRRPGSTQAQDDATLLALRDQERAGLDIVTDGEMRRESYSNRFAIALDGMDADNPGAGPARTPGRFQIVPRVVGPHSPHAAGSGERRGVPARGDRPADPHHGARSFHHDAAMFDEYYNGPKKRWRSTARRR